MRRTIVNRNHVAEAFHMPNAPALIAQGLHKSTVTATELRCDHPNFGITASMPRENAYLIALQLRACHDHDLYFDGRIVRPKNYLAGVTSIYDLRHDPVADIRDPYQCIMFHLPRKALDAMTYEAGAPRAGNLRYEPGVSIDDPIVHNLLSSLRPAIAKQEEAHPLFLDRVGLALTAHMAHTYGGVNSNAGIPRGGLAPWQERRVKELMSACLNEEVPLSRLASECGLSVRHFARAFRQSTGISPHRWLLKHRVDCARRLLSNRALSLSDVALSCGFADQSHFTRVFRAMVGVSPGAWRRANGLFQETQES
jgi:AraC-like DNA-binding protein